MAPMAMNSDIFTYKYDLVPPTFNEKSLGAGAAAGIAAGIFIVVVAVATFLLFFIRKCREDRKKAAVPAKASVRERGVGLPTHTTTTSTTSRVVPAPPPYPTRHELASPQSEREAWIVAHMSPTVPPVSPTSPLSYAPSRQSIAGSPVQGAPVEMPGSTWMNEHHPAFVSGSASGDAGAEAPNVPPPLSRADLERAAEATAQNNQRNAPTESC
jgi:hypothetical protein